MVDPRFCARNSEIDIERADCEMQTE
jgi:hypothetical protein